jgi:FdhD protein
MPDPNTLPLAPEKAFVLEVNGTPIVTLMCTPCDLDVPNGLRWFYEDVGRHNAVDKAIGRGLVDGVDFSRCCLICSGRLAVEMAAKTIAAGIPIFASRSMPTTAAYDMAVEKGLTMIGRCSSPSPVVYTMRERVS